MLLSPREVGPRSSGGAVAVDRIDQWLEDTAAIHRRNPPRGTGTRVSPRKPLGTALVLCLLVAVTAIVIAAKRSSQPDTSSPSFSDGYTLGKGWTSTYVAAGGGLISMDEIRSSCRDMESKLSPASGWNASSPPDFVAGCTQAAVDNLGSRYSGS
jgi:hypothetical protein